MSQFLDSINEISKSYDESVKIKEQMDSIVEDIGKMNDRYATMLEAQQLLASVSDKNTEAVLSYITGIINKTLGELFPHDPRRIYLEKVMFQGKNAHINIKLTGTGGRPRDITLQTGTGLRQVISFLFVLSMIEIRKGRRILLMDELLSGLHPEAKRVVSDIITIFAEEGFQFAFVEYGINNLGKIYLVEKPGEVATVTPMDGAYHDEVFVFNRPPEEVDLTINVEE